MEPVCFIPGRLVEGGHQPLGWNAFQEKIEVWPDVELATAKERVE